MSSINFPNIQREIIAEHWILKSQLSAKLVQLPAVCGGDSARKSEFPGELNLVLVGLLVPHPRGNLWKRFVEKSH